ncbi:EAL domain-containing protein [Malikia spinosa]|uniref:EAL domain-containing protein n=1 Tax=Malikia spinosa TaxID=86180 RepID=UPI003FA2F236
MVNFGPELPSENGQFSVGVNSLAHSLGQKVVAEGIETDEQLSYLKRSGCDMGQGYLFSRPLPADQLIAFIRQHNS